MGLPKRTRHGQTRSQPRSEQRLRATVFCLCKELGIDDEARRILAGVIRADGKETMAGMKAGELYEMVRELGRRDAQRQTAHRAVDAAQRQESLRKHKRVDGPDSAWASERARHFLRARAEEFYGPEWPSRLGIFLGGLWIKWEKRCAVRGQATQRPRGSMSVRAAARDLLFVPWDSETMPRNFHHWATEAMLAMIQREAGRR